MIQQLFSQMQDPPSQQTEAPDMSALQSFLS